jgi:hypothetical protein
MEIIFKKTKKWLDLNFNKIEKIILVYYEVLVYYLKITVFICILFVRSLIICLIL